MLRSPGSFLNSSTRSRCALLAGAALLAGVAAAPAFAKTAVVLNSDEDTFSIIDTEAYKETARTHIGRQPHHLIVTPDQKTLIIANAGGNELVFIDRATGTVQQRTEVSDPYQVGFSPDAKWFVSNSLRLDRIDLYNAANYQLVHRLPAPKTPSHIGFSPDSSTAYVSLQGTGQLIAIDLVSGQQKWVAPIGKQPAGVFVRPSGNVLVAIMGADHIVEVDPRDGTIIRRIKTDRGAHNFLLSPDGKTLYVSNRVAGTVSALDAEKLEVNATFAAPGGPDDMAWSPDGKELWITGRWRASVDVLDRDTGALKTRIPVGRSPHGIFVY